MTWACVGAIIGLELVVQAITTFLGVGGMMPDDRLPFGYGIYIGVPLGGYLGWRIGPGIVPGLKRLLRRR